MTTIGQANTTLGFPPKAIIIAVGAVILDAVDQVLLVKHVPEPGEDPTRLTLRRGHSP